MATKQKPGSKLARSEVVQVRFDTKLRMAAELAAAKERRSLSSLIEWAVQLAVRDVEVANKDGVSMSAAAVAEQTWDTDVSDRFVKLATQFPELLTHEELQLWKTIREFNHEADGEDGCTMQWRLIDENGPKLAEIRRVWDTLRDLSRALAERDYEQESTLNGVLIDERFGIRPERLRR